LGDFWWLLMASCANLSLEIFTPFVYCFLTSEAFTVNPVLVVVVLMYLMMARMVQKFERAV